MKSLRFYCAPVFFFATALSLTALEPEQSCALAGDIIAGPVASEGRATFVLSDRTVTCISDTGAYLWRKPLGGRPAPFIFVSSCGQVFAVANGRLESFSPDGYFLWSMRGAAPPVFGMREGTDGRLFLPLGNRLVCISPQGAVKWTRYFDAEITDALEITGDGDVLVFLGDKIVRISPFGEDLETRKPEEPISAFLPVRGGYIAGSPSGMIRAYDIRNGRAAEGRSDTECVWTAPGGAVPVVALSALDGTLLSLYGDGSMRGYNGTDGTLLWTVSSGLGSVAKASIRNDYGQFTISSPSGFCAVSLSGALLRSSTITKSETIPALSPDGVFYVSAENWVLNIYRPEVRIKSEKKLRKKENYGILEGQSSVYGISILNDSGRNSAFFDRVTLDIASGTVGIKEVDYARQLRELLSGTTGADPDSGTTAGTEQGRAASLLGQLGSSEYRDALILAARQASDDSAAIGILYGLAATGADTDGESLAAIQTISLEAGSSADAVQKAVCDALYAVIRYSSGSISRSGAEMLGKFLYEPYSTNVRNYARTILGNILH
jgi:hypothetical protein